MSDNTVLDSIKDLTAYINGEPNTVTNRSYKLKKHLIILVKKLGQYNKQSSFT